MSSLEGIPANVPNRRFDDEARLPTGCKSLSVIIPVFNEEENIRPLLGSVVSVLQVSEVPFEIIVVNDGSRDKTAAILAELAARDSRIKLINLRQNTGQTAAMMAGFDYASGEVMIPMDGDQQNDPADIPRLLRKLADGYDVVSGWRKSRKDKLFFRRIPSWIANRLISWVSGVKLHDYGCTLKAYRRDVLADVRLYGELHRFVPIFAYWQGGRIAELPVNHLPRRFGKSKYGLNRVIKVILDLILVRFLTKYHSKPIYVFGFTGLGFFVIALLAGLYAVYLKMYESTSFIQTPLPLLVVMGFMSGMMCILLGLICEVLVRTYFESQNRTYYSVASVQNIEKK